jgi:hypothetical protein
MTSSDVGTKQVFFQLTKVKKDAEVGTAYFSANQVVFGLVWRVTLFPNGVTQDHSGKASLFLDLVSQEKSWGTSYGIRILNCKGADVFCNIVCSEPYKTTKTSFGRYGANIIGLSTEQLFSSKNGYWSTDEEKVSLLITFQPHSKQDFFVLPDFFGGFKEHLFDPSFADLSIDVENVKLPAHKLILVNYSPVFLAMFENGMKETNTNTIAITDFPEEVVRSALKCLYMPLTMSDEFKQCGEQLLYFANKYSIKVISKFAERYFESNMNTENALNVLIAADMTNNTVIKTYAINTILSQSDVIFKQHTNLAETLGISLCNELFAALVQYKLVKL